MSVNKYRLLFMNGMLALTCCAMPVANAVDTDAKIIARARQALLYADEKNALDLLKPIAENGNSEAMLILASRLSRPKNWEFRDEVLANEFFEKAFNNNYPPALAEKARRYLYGDRGSQVNPDIAKGVSLYQEASDRGLASASDTLAHLFFDGKFTTADNYKAFYFATRAFEQGSGYGAYLLGKYYRDGIGIEPDFVKAYGLLLVACYNLSSTCEEAEQIAAKLEKEQKERAIYYIKELLQLHPDLLVLRPLELDFVLSNATRARLLREYKLNSPLFALAQYGNKEKYSATNRLAFTYMFLLSEPIAIPVNQKNASNKNWKKLLQKIFTQLTSLDRERIRKMAKVLDESESLLRKIDKELSDDELRYLVALYRSEIGRKIHRLFQLTKDLEEDGNTQVWESLATSGKTIDSINAVALEYFDDYENKVPVYKQELDRECNLWFLELRDQVSEFPDYLSKGASAGFPVLAQLPIMMAKRRSEWVAFCVGPESTQLKQVLAWKPVQREINIIKTWKTQSIDMAQVKEIYAEYNAALLQLSSGER